MALKKKTKADILKGVLKGQLDSLSHGDIVLVKLGAGETGCGCYAWDSEVLIQGAITVDADHYWAQGQAVFLGPVELTEESSGVNPCVIEIKMISTAPIIPGSIAVDSYGTKWMAQEDGNFVSTMGETMHYDELSEPRIIYRAVVESDDEDEEEED